MIKSEVDDLGTMNLNDGFFNYGVHVTHERSGEKYIMPEKIGRWVSTIPEGQAELRDVVKRPLVPCAEVFTDLN